MGDSEQQESFDDVPDGAIPNFDRDGNEIIRGTTEQDRLSFDGTLTKTGITVSVSAVGGAIIYAVGIILAIAILATTVAGLAVYFKNR